MPAADLPRFVKSHWYKHGEIIDKPYPRLRVSSPEATLNPDSRERWEGRDNGLALIDLPTFPHEFTSAEAYVEAWGGHPGTINKRMIVNGRSTYELPDNPPAYVSHHFTTHDLPLTDLVPSLNAFQFACEQKDTFWGHYLIDGLNLRGVLPPDHQLLKDSGLADYAARLAVSTDQERVDFKLDGPTDGVQRVDVRGTYLGYPAHGGPANSEHGYTLDGGQTPINFLLSTSEQPYEGSWDTTMIPDQPGPMGLRAIVHFKDGLSYETPAVEVDLPRAEGAGVSMHFSREENQSQWVRQQSDSRHIVLDDADLENATACRLHLSLWDGGSGDVSPPFSFNGKPLVLLADASHKSRYLTEDVDPTNLQPGENAFTAGAMTDHHGVEILLPGVALTIRRQS